MFNYQEYSCFANRPSNGIRYLVGRNLDRLIDMNISEATKFQQTNEAKAKALDILKYSLLIGEDRITPHTERIITSLIKISQLDQISQIPGCGQKVQHIVEIIGHFVKSEYYIPLIIHVLAQEDVKGSTKNTVVLLNILGHMLLKSEGLEQHIDLITATLASYEQQFLDNDEGLTALFKISHTLLKRVEHISDKFLHLAYQIFVNLQATKTVPQATRNQSVPAFATLATKCGYASVEELHAAEIGPILERMMKNKQYTNWNRTSKNRFKFDTIVRNCRSQARRFLPDILCVFEFLVNPQCDLETRIDTLVLIEHVIELPELREALAPLSQQLLKRVLVTAIQWKVGKPQIKIRLAGVINIIKLIAKGIIAEEQLLDCFKDLVPNLKGCLTDDWAPELRLASCELVEKYLLATKQKIGDDQLRELYPILLQRLDDSQDQIRVKISVAINVFFSCRYIKLSESTLEYVINAIFVHFDDSNEEIRSAIFLNLRYAALIDPKSVLKHAESNLKRMRNKQSCTELIQFCREKIEEYDS